jgi:hypothetical protein
MNKILISAILAAVFNISSFACIKGTNCPEDLNPVVKETVKVKEKCLFDVADDFVRNKKFGKAEDKFKESCDKKGTDSCDSKSYACIEYAKYLIFFHEDKDSWAQAEKILKDRLTTLPKTETDKFVKKLGTDFLSPDYSDKDGEDYVISAYINGLLGDLTLRKISTSGKISKNDINNPLIDEAIVYYSEACNVSGDEIKLYKNKSLLVASPTSCVYLGALMHDKAYYATTDSTELARDSIKYFKTACNMAKIPVSAADPVLKIRSFDPSFSTDFLATKRSENNNKLPKFCDYKMSKLPLEFSFPINEEPGLFNTVEYVLRFTNEDGFKHFLRTPVPPRK